MKLFAFALFLRIRRIETGTTIGLSKTIAVLRTFAAISVDFLQSVKLTSELPDTHFSLLDIRAGLVEFGMEEKYQAGGYSERAIREVFHDFPERPCGTLPIRRCPESRCETQVE
jgi:hypothetical protein